MLKAILTDFRLWGRFQTSTTVDARLDSLPLPADKVVTVMPGDYDTTFSSLVAESTAVLLIAPETGNLLAKLTATVERMGVPLLGSSSAAVAIATDKLACYEKFCQAGLPTPTTRAIRFTDDVEAAARELGYPLVAKPIDGVGCEGVVFIGNDLEIPVALGHLRQATRREDFLLEKYVEGTHGSVSLLAAQGVVLPLTLNKQEIRVLNGQFAYQGGCVPLEHPLRSRALAVAQQAISLLPGLRGYVGVDLVLAEDEAFLMEINPRLTTSYIGLRQVLNLNLAEAIWAACLTGQLPEKIATVGQVSFTKEDLATLYIGEAP